VVSRLNRALLRETWHLRGQVLAAALVVSCGLAAFVTMRSVYHSLIEARAQYYADYRFADVFAHLKRAPESVADELRAVPGVSTVETRVVADVTLSVPGLDEPATGRLVSLPPVRRPMLNDLYISEGRYPDTERNDEILVSSAFARANGLAVGSHLGAVLNGRWKDFTIVGLALSPEYVYEVSPGMVFPDNRRFGLMWMNGEALAAALDMQGAFNDVALSLAHGAQEDDVINEVDRLLRPFGGLSAYDRRDQESNRFLTDELGEIQINATYVPAIFLSVAAFLLYMLLSRLVAMQRGQIALLKAFGYSNARIGLHFLEFALIVVGLGLLIGLGLGAWLGAGLIRIYQDYFHFPALVFRMPLSVMLLAAGIASGAATIGSLAAVRRAVRLPPAEAMRPEPPRSFRAGVFEATGLARLLGTGTRMIARNIARRPLRAALSVTAIAIAVATVVMGRFVFDAVNDLMAVHFDFAQRDDVTVILHEARGPAVVENLAALPGVMRVEPFRAVPVWLRFGHREKRSVLIGLSPDMDLRQIVDSERRRIDLPPAGLVMTRKLAEILGAQPGDSLEVEALEGTRERFNVPLTRVSDEPLGVSAYMDADALARLLREDRVVSGALLQVDSLAAQALYTALKRTPAVAVIAVRDAMLNSIRGTMNRSFTLMTVILTVFAAVLVVGVVYNSARIAISERGHELASLRVLGFTSGEIMALLLGEQAILTLMAIPAGLGLGALICRLLVPVFDRELFRLPFALSGTTLGFATAVTVAAAIFSALLVARRLATLDLIAVLKTRE
jgi:putative ABC transport system permease protein